MFVIFDCSTLRTGYHKGQRSMFLTVIVNKHARLMLRVTTFRLVTVTLANGDGVLANGDGVKLHISIKLKENKAHYCKHWNYTENTYYNVHCGGSVLV